MLSGRSIGPMRAFARLANRAAGERGIVVPVLVVAALALVLGNVPQGLAIERELLAQAFASTDAAEGLSAYKEKRVAKFEGK